MANPLFYRQVVPLNRETHSELHLKAPDKPLEFARPAHLIPALTDEFATAMSEIAVAFLPGAANPTAVFIAGLKPGENSFITDKGTWSGSYVPAYLRRYPFIVGDVPNADPILCIDDSFEGFTRQGGERLFSKSGELTPVVTNALSLANNYRLAALRTDEFCATLQRFALFRSVTLDTRRPDGQTTVVHGLLVVDEQTLAGLSDERLLELRRLGYLKLIYAHLFSLAAVSKLPQKAPAPAVARERSGRQSANR